MGADFPKVMTHLLKSVTTFPEGMTAFLKRMPTLPEWVTALLKRMPTLSEGVTALPEGMTAFPPRGKPLSRLAASPLRNDLVARYSWGEVTLLLGPPGGIGKRNPG